jgi:flagellar protein FliS
MQGALARAAQAYRHTEASSRSPIELIVMLYDGALRFLSQARDAMERQDVIAKRTALSRALEIVSELQSILNMREGGEIAVSLDSLYAWVHKRIIEANLNNDPVAIDEARRVLIPLRDAWAELAVTANLAAARESS